MECQVRALVKPNKFPNRHEHSSTADEHLNPSPKCLESCLFIPALTKKKKQKKTTQDTA
jgi:hypothetical protein